MAESDSNAPKKAPSVPPPASSATPSAAPSGATASPTPTSAAATAQPNIAKPATAQPNIAKPAAAQPTINVASWNIENGAITEKVPVLLVTPIGETGQKLRQKFETEQSATINAYEAQANVAASMAKQLIPCLMIGSIAQNNDIVKLLNILQAIKADVKANRIKFIVFSKIKNSAIIKSFETLGCHEFIVEPINERSLMFKINLQTKSLTALRKQLRKAEIDEKEGRGGLKKISADKTKQDDGELIGDDGKTKLAEAQENDKDCWVFQGNKPKKQGGKWTMRMKGPDPSSGDWIETGKDEEGHSKWRFAEKDEKGNPIDPKDAAKKPGWEFTGEKPQFQNGEWGFQGEKPDLSLVDEAGAKQASKMKSDGADGLVLSKDSQAALKAQAAIEKKQAQDKEQKKKNLFAGSDSDEEKSKEKNKENAKEGDAEKSKKAAVDFAMDFEDDAPEKNDLKGDSKEKDKKKNAEKKPNAEGKFDFSDDEDESVDKAEDLKASEKNKSSKDAKNKESKNNDTKKKDLMGMAMDFSDTDGPDDLVDSKEAKDLGTKDHKSKDPKAANAREIAFVDDEDSQANLPDFNNPFDVEGRLKSEKEGKQNAENKKKDPAALASMAMDFSDSDDEEGGSAAASGVGIKGKKGNKKSSGPAIDFAEGDESDSSDEQNAQNKDGKNKKKNNTKNTKNTNDTEKENAFDFSDIENAADEKSDSQKDEKNEKKNDKKSKNKKDEKFDFGDIEDEGSSDDDLSAADKNFLKKKKKKTEDGPEFAEDDPSAFSVHQGVGDGAKKQKWGGKDSPEFHEDSDDEDKLVEIDAVNGSLKAGKKSDLEIFEFPEDYFGSKDGVWENAGTDSKEKLKIFVFVPPEVRSGKAPELKTIKPWWIFKASSVELRPAFLSSKKVWQCKGQRPTSVAEFKFLSALVKEFLESIHKVPLSDSKRTSADGVDFAETPPAKSDGEASDLDKKSSAAFDFSDIDDANEDRKEDDKEDGESKDLKNSSDQTKLDDPAATPPKETFTEFEDATSSTDPAVKTDETENKFADSDSPIVNQQSPSAEAQTGQTAEKFLLPAPPMMAVFVSEILLSSKGDVLKVLAYFSGVVSKSYPAASVTIFAFHPPASDFKSRVVMTTGKNFEFNTEKDFSSDQVVRDVVIKQSSVLSQNKVYCPIQYRHPKTLITSVLGLVLVETSIETVRFDDHVNYLHLLSQTLRGPMLQLEKELSIQVEKAA